MAIDAYSQCPCGSGKKFKWCCQPFYGQIEKAHQQWANNQHETALRLMEQLTQDHPGNAAVWGQRAEMLWEADQQEQADEALQKALEVNPNYAYGYFLRGMFRHEEGEITGALLLYRKAADLCDPEARELMAEVQFCIGQCEILANRPLAAHAAWEIARRCHPSSETIQERLAEYFDPQKKKYPPLACREYAFQKPAATVSAERRQAWQQALAGHETGKLADAARAFEQLATEDATDAAAWYNLGLVRAWFGDHPQAIAAFDNYVALETDETAAAAAWALTEVLRFGKGMEDASDWVEHRVVYKIVDPRAAGPLLSQDPRLIDVQQRQGMFAGSLLEREVPPATENLALYELPHVVAFFLIAGDLLILTHADPDMVDCGRRIIESLLGPAISEPTIDKRLGSFPGTPQYFLALRIPEGLTEKHAQHLIDDSLQQTFEEKWLKRPLRSLNQVAPVDAVGLPILRRKVLGLIQFLEDLYHAFVPLPYDFDRVRHKLGLPTVKPVVAAAGDVTAMNAAELAALNVEELSDGDLEQAFQAGQRLDARELAGRFARVIVDRPPRADKPDRYPQYVQLINQALDQGQAAEALALVEAAAKHDSEQNEGRRQRDYALRQAQIHLRAGQPDQAQEVYARLIQQVPSSLDILGTATEAMLSAKQPQHALTFAEQGLAQAKAQGDRDRIGYFEEMLAAAKRL